MAVLKFLIILEPGASHFQFALDPANERAGLVPTLLPSREDKCSAEEGDSKRDREAIWRWYCQALPSQLGRGQRGKPHPQGGEPGGGLQRHQASRALNTHTPGGMGAMGEGFLGRKGHQGRELRSNVQVSAHILFWPHTPASNMEKGPLPGPLKDGPVKQILMGLRHPFGTPHP